MKLRISSVIFLFTLLFHFPIYAQSLRIGIAETPDAYTGTLGLGSMLNAEGRLFSDFSSNFETGTFPDLSNTDLLVIGSFLTNDPQKKATYIAGAGTLRSFVQNGGTVVVLCQADQDMQTETWVEPPRSITHSDADLASLQILRTSHLLLQTPETITVPDLTNWKVPSTWGAYNTGWETFNSYNAAVAILGSGTGSDLALVEMGWGSGRALFYAMAIDKAYQGGNAVSQAASVKLMRNILNYAEQVKAGTAPAVVISSNNYAFPVQGLVFIDQNGNGVKDAGEIGRGSVRVSDGLDVVQTQANGSYVLPNASGDARFVYVCQPNDSPKSAKSFYKLISPSDPESARYDLPVLPVAANQSTTSVLFAQISDIHTKSDAASQTDQIKGLQEIAARKPRPEFIVATGDLCDSGVAAQFNNYLQAAASVSLPCFNIIGNHDNSSGTDLYRSHMGPDYYSFDHGGIHFVARNVISPSARQDTWLQNDLANVTSGTPVVFLQHYPPTAAEMSQFGSGKVNMVFSGHWHSEKQVKSGITISQNSPNFVMGGIDCSPAGYRIVQMSSNGSNSSEWCYGGVSQKMAVISPSSAVPNWNQGFPIIVNAYDSSNPPKSINWTMSQSGKPILTGSLRKDSPVSWSGQYASPTGLPATSLCDFRIQVTDMSGKIWSLDRKVVLDDRGPNPVSLNSKDWPMFMADPGHSGDAGAPTTVPMRLVWSTPTKGDLDFSSPILAEGRIYMGYKSRSTASEKGVMALDPKDGKLIWRTPTAFSINHTPAYSSGIICVAEVGGRVYGLNAQTGAQIWQRDLLDNIDRYSYCAPAEKDGKFYVGTMRRLARLSASDGAVDWEASLAGRDWISSYASPAVGNTQIAMGGMSAGTDNMTILQENNGAKIRGYAADGGIAGSPTIYGNYLLFASKSSTLYCIDLATGTQIWAQSLGSGWSATTPAVSNGMVICASGDGQVKAFNLANGAPRWSFSAGSSIFKLSPYRRDTRGLSSSPTIAGNKVMIGSDDGRLYCLDLISGQMLWNQYFGVPVMSTPLISGNALFVGAYDGRVYAFTVSNVPATPETNHADSPTWSGLK